MKAIQRLGGREGHEMLADACGPRKNQAWRDRCALNGARQQRDEFPMTDDVSKRHNRPTRRIVSLLSSFLGVVRLVLAPAKNARPEAAFLLRRLVRGRRWRRWRIALVGHRNRGTARLDMDRRRLFR